MKIILTLFVLMFSIGAFATQHEILPIKNTNPSINKTMSRTEVYWIYSMRTRFWENGQKITVFYHGFESAVHKDFVFSVLKQTPSQFERSISIYVNNGNASYFRQVSSDLEMKSVISNTPGAIGYISKDVLMINKGNGNVETFIITN